MIVSSSDAFPLYYPYPKLLNRKGVPHFGSNPTFNVKYNDEFWLKDNCYSLVDMFGAREMGL